MSPTIFKTAYMRSFFLLFLVLLMGTMFSGSVLFAQDCTVSDAKLKGTYEGACDHGKANGKGKATGTDTYEGEFKAGLPDGEGVYTWKNGDVYKGKFVKGKRDGQGTMTYKKENAADSLVAGFWKKDNYIGKYEKPYLIHYSSRSITETTVKYKKDAFNQVNLLIINTSGGSSSMSAGEGVKFTVDDIQMIHGGYGRLMTNSDHAKKTEMILYNVWYPARMRIKIGTETLELELLEEGSYIVNVSINQ